ncbi:FAD-binding oxidoreductase [Thalassobaculum sp.]|uniref:NAD(P)/FAD-dependent oxidoreductase n=1 Tax=Thalassobaculum sp. TaxID=2022740 RepID=UPI0032EB73C0
MALVPDHHMSAPPTWYHATAPAAPSRPPLSGPLRARACVVGGGLCGVSAALHLAERGIDTVLLEAEAIGHGASGRNGGQIVQGFSAPMERIEAAVGRADAQVFWDMGREAIAAIPERVARHGIDCDLRWGYLIAALNRRQLDDLRETVAQWAGYGYTGPSIVEGAGLRTVLGTDLYAGGMLEPGSGQLHPLAYLRGLAAAAEAAGARLHEQSAAVAIDHGDTVRVSTAGGSVEADILILAGNAYLGRLVPSLNRRLMPVASFVGVTVPLGEERARRLFPQDVAVADCNVALDYYRLTADRRLLFGAGASYSATTPAGLKDWLARRFRRVFPELTDVTVEHAWGGLIGITHNRIPDFGRLAPNVLYAQGFSGQGVALTGLAGTLLAEAATGDDSRFRLVERIRHLPFPGGLLRTPTLVAAMGVLKLKDRLGW